MCLRYALILFVVTGCNEPSPVFRGMPATRIAVDGSVFDVRVKGLQAEAIRVNMEYALRFAPIQHKAEVAMAQVSGCVVLDVTGDQAQAFGRLDCDRAGRAPARIVAPNYACYALSGDAEAKRKQDAITLRCQPE